MRGPCLYVLLKKLGNLAAKKCKALDIISVLEGLEMNTDSTHWVSTRWMLADAMTDNLKEAHGLRVIMTTAHFSLNSQNLEPENYDSEDSGFGTLRFARDAPGAH